MKKFLKGLGWTAAFAACFCALFAIGFFGYTLLFGENPEAASNQPATLLPTDLEAMASQDVAGENCTVVYRHFYTECSHTEDETLPPPNEYNGKPLEEALGRYPETILESKTDESIVIKVYEHKKCEKHYVARLEDDGIVVRQQNDLNIVKQRVDTPVSALSYEDTVLLTQGIYLESNEELTKFLEDFGS